MQTIIIIVIIIILINLLTSFVYKGMIMYVCICHDIKDSQIKNAISQGVDTLQKLQDTLAVATCCGCCQPMVQDLLDEHHAKVSVIDVIAS